MPNHAACATDQTVRERESEREVGADLRRKGKFGSFIKKCSALSRNIEISPARGLKMNSSN